MEIAALRSEYQATHTNDPQEYLDQSLKQSKVLTETEKKNAAVAAKQAYQEKLKERLKDLDQSVD